MNEETAVKTEPVMLTSEERHILLGLIAARNAVMEQIEGVMSSRVAARLGVHRNRIANADANTGVITLASDAPKPAEG